MRGINEPRNRRHTTCTLFPIHKNASDSAGKCRPCEYTYQVYTTRYKSTAAVYDQPHTPAQHRCREAIDKNCYHPLPSNLICWPLSAVRGHASKQKQACQQSMPLLLLFLDTTTPTSYWRGRRRRRRRICGVPRRRRDRQRGNVAGGRGHRGSHCLSRAPSGYHIQSEETASSTAVCFQQRAQSTQHNVVFPSKTKREATHPTRFKPIIISPHFCFLNFNFQVLAPPFTFRPLDHHTQHGQAQRTAQQLRADRPLLFTRPSRRVRTRR